MVDNMNSNENRNSQIKVPEPLYSNFKELFVSSLTSNKDEHHYSLILDYNRIVAYVKDRELRKSLRIIDIHVRDVIEKKIWASIPSGNIYEKELKEIQKELRETNAIDVYNEIKDKLSSIEYRIYKPEVQVSSEDWIEETSLQIKFFVLTFKWYMKTERRAFAVASTYTRKLQRQFNNVIIKPYFGGKYPSVYIVPISELERAERDILKIIKVIVKESEALKRKPVQVPKVEKKEKKIEITEEIVQAVLKDWMRVWIFKPNFITEKRGAERVYEIIEEDGIKKVLDGYKYEEVKRELERFRVRFYRSFVNRRTIQTPFGKVFVELDDETKSELNSWIEAYYKIVDKVFQGKVRPRPCELIEIMIPRKTMRRYVEQYVTELRARLKNLEEKIKELEEEAEEDKKAKKKLRDAIKEKNRVEEMLEFAESVLEKHFGEKKAEIVSERVEALKEEIENGEGE